MTDIAQKQKHPALGPRRITAALLSLLSLAALALVVLLPPWREVEQARSARRAAEPFIAARRVIEPLLEYRRNAGEWVAGTGRVDSVQLKQQANQVDALLKSLETTVCQPGFDESRQMVTSLRSDWENIRRGIPTWAQSGEFAVYTEHASELLNPLRQLAAAAARQQPEVQSLAVLVADVDDLSQTAFALRHAARSRRFEREMQGRISRLLGRLESRQTLLPEDLLAGTRAEFLRKLESDILRDPVPVEESTAMALIRDAEQAIQQELQRADQSLSDWSGRLDSRVAAARRSAGLTALALLAAMVAALGASYLLFRTWPSPAPTDLPAQPASSPLTSGEPTSRRVAALAAELDETADEAEVILENASIHLAAQEAPVAADVERCLEHLRQLRTQITRIQSELAEGHGSIKDQQEAVATS